MNVISWVLTATLALSIPASLITWVWTGDLRWLATGILIAAFFGLVTVMGKDKDTE